MEKLK